MTLAILKRAPRELFDPSQAMRPFLLADSPGGKPLATEACNDLTKKDWDGWEWAYGQSALSLLGQSEDLVAAAGDFQRRTHRFPFAESDVQLFRKLLAYWAGEVPAQALLDAAAGSGGNLCRAHYFIGISQWARENGTRPARSSARPWPRALSIRGRGA